MRGNKISPLRHACHALHFPAIPYCTCIVQCTIFPYLVHCVSSCILKPYYINFKRKISNFKYQVRKCHRTCEIFMWISICKHWHVWYDSGHYVITFFNFGISDLLDYSCENAQFTLERTIGTIYQWKHNHQGDTICSMDFWVKIFFWRDLWYTTIIRVIDILQSSVTTFDGLRFLSLILVLGWILLINKNVNTLAEHFKNSPNSKKEIKI